MSFFWDELDRVNTARDKEWNPNNLLSLSFRGNELAGEIGEACNVIKKLERERLGLVGSRATLEQAGLELADGVICIALLSMELNLNMGHYVPKKFNITSRERGLSIFMDEGQSPFLRHPR